jgi:hypothetical protein
VSSRLSKELLAAHLDRPTPEVKREARAEKLAVPNLETIIIKPSSIAHFPPSRCPSFLLPLMLLRHVHSRFASPLSWSSRSLTMPLRAKVTNPAFGSRVRARWTHLLYEETLADNDDYRCSRLQQQSPRNCRRTRPTMCFSTRITV